jgi:hypothetical protein
VQDQQSDYAAQWQDLRRRIVIFFVCWLGGFVAIVVMSRLNGDNAKYLFPLWAIAFYVSGARWSMFRCPRCGEPYFKPNAWGVNQFLRKCPHCGLRKWTHHE